MSTTILNPKKLATNYCSLKVKINNAESLIIYLIQLKVPFFAQPAKGEKTEYSFEVVIRSEFINGVVVYFINNNIPFALNSFVNQPSSKVKVSNTNDSKSQDTKELLLKYFSSFEEMPANINTAARIFGLSAGKLNLLIQKEFGKTYYQIYLEKKMDYAANLLKGGNNASEVSNLIGYSHPIKFNKMFQKHFGITPKKYQMRQMLMTIKNTDSIDR